MSERGFEGYLRENNLVGVRNYVGVFSTVACANQLTSSIADKVKNCVSFTHSHGCGQVKSDLKIVEEVLLNLITNPNIGAAIIVGIGCEGVQVNELYQKIIKITDKPIETVILMDEGGYKKAVASGIRKAQILTNKISAQKKQWQPLSELVIGIKCGASDTTSGLISNPLVGKTVDLLIDEGATVIFGEVTEFIGAEHSLAKRCKTEKVKKRLLAAVDEIEKRIILTGEDIRGGQPSEGNIRGGITTLEEKSLGAINKSGHRAITGFLEYGEKPSGKGLFAMNFPGREPEALTALAAAGTQIIIFTTGLGAPQGFPFVPIIKVTGNKNTAINMKPHIDYYESFFNSEKDSSSGAEKLLKKIIDIANGEKSKSEKLDFYEPSNIWVKGPVI